MCKRVVCLDMTSYQEQNLTATETSALRMAVNEGEVISCGSFPFDILLGMQRKGFLTEIGHDMFSATALGYNTHLIEG